jgi:signal transduction histidine kinase
MNYRVKLFIYFILFGLTLTFFVSYSFYKIIEEKNISEAKKDAQNELKTYSDNLQRYFKQKENILISIFTNNIFLEILYREYLPNKSEHIRYVEELFRTTIESNKDIYGIRYIDFNSNEIIKVKQIDNHIIPSTKNKLKKNIDKYYIKEIQKLNFGEFYYSDIEFISCVHNNKQIIIPVIRVGINMSDLGVLIFAIKIDKLYNLINRDNIYSSYILDNNGDIWLSSDKKYNQKIKIDKKLQNIDKMFRLYKTNILTMDSFHEKNFFSKRLNFTNNKITILVNFNDKQYQSNNQKIFNIFINILIIMLIISLVLSYFFARPLINLNKKIEKVQQKEISNMKLLSIGMLSAGITHEINTPLTYIKGNLEMMRYDTDDIKEQKVKDMFISSIDVILDGVDRISRIIESVREISSISSDTKDVLDIKQTIIIALNLLHNRSKHISNIYLDGELFDISSQNIEPSYQVVGQKQRLEQVWIVIINNALDELIKIEPFESRRVDIDIYQKLDKVIVSFKDNANGIDEQIIDKIFEPLVSKKESNGMGLGLNIAKTIMIEHDGEILVSNHQNGAIFEVVLPIYQKIVG